MKKRKYNFGGGMGGNYVQAATEVVGNIGKTINNTSKDNPNNTISVPDQEFGSMEEAINKETIRTTNPSEKLSLGEEIGFGILDTMLAPVSAVTGKSFSGLLGKNQGKGSKVGQIEAWASNNIAKPILKAIPITAPFAQAVDAVGKAVAPAMPDQQNNQITNPSLKFANGGSITMSRGQFIKEHNRLLKTLKSPSHKDDLREYNEQSQEMKKYLSNGGNMGLTDYKGLTHEQGGIQIPGKMAEVEDSETKFDVAEYVFSDRIKVPGSDHTFASKSKSIRNRYSKRPDDAISIEAMNKELSNLMNSQEAIKMEKFAKQVNKTMSMAPEGLDISPLMQMFGGKQYRYGGKLRKYAKGGPINPPGDEAYVTYDEMGNPIPADVLYAPTDTTVPTPEPKERTPQMGDTNVEGGIEKVFEPKAKAFSESYDMAGNSPLGYIGSSIGPLANVIAAIGAKNARLTPSLKLKRINTRPAEVIAQQQGDTALASGVDAIKNVAPTSGSYLANVGNLASNVASEVGRNVAGIRYEGDLQNVGIANQESAMNNQIMTNNNLLQDQSDAQRWNLGLKAAENLGNNLSTMGAEQNLANRDLLALDLLGTENYEYVREKDPKTRKWKIVKRYKTTT